MKPKRALFVFVAGLPIVIWALVEFSRNAGIERAADKTVKDSIPVSEEATGSTPPRNLSRLTALAFPRPSESIFPDERTHLESTLASSESPGHSDDLDKNRDWARSYPNEALAWLSNAPDSKQRATIAEIVCPQLVQTNIEQAVSLAERCYAGDTNVMQNLLDNLAQLWAERDESAAYAWATSKPPGEDRDRLLQRIAFTQANSDPAEAARLVAEQISPGEIQNEAAISVLHQWAQHDAAAAMAWAQSFAVGDLHDRAIKEVENATAPPPQAGLN